MTSKPIIFKRSGSTIYSSNGDKSSYEKLYELLKKKVSFRVIRVSDNRDITNKILENIEKKIWTEMELEMLQTYYGKLTLPEIHKLHLTRKSVGQIRHKASELNITVDQRWQDYEVKALTALRKSGVSFPIIAKILSRPKHAVEVKAHKVGVVFGGRSKEELDMMEEGSAIYKKLNSLPKGKIAEDLTSIRLTEEGFDVFVPYTPNHKTDLLVVDSNKVAKIQVKAAVWEKSSGRFRVPLTIKNPKTHKRRTYDAVDIDFFIFVCLAINAFYVVPYDLCNNYRGAHLYPHRPKMIQKGFDWEIYRESFSLIERFFECKE